MDVEFIAYKTAHKTKHSRKGQTPQCIEGIQSKAIGYAETTQQTNTQTKKGHWQ